MPSPDSSLTSELARLLRTGEGPTIEFKRTTGQLREGMQTLCAFLNGAGGVLLFGVGPDGSPTGQMVSDGTLQDIAAALGRFEPPVAVTIQRLPARGGREILLLRAEAMSAAVPYVFDGRAYERVGSTTRRMPQEQYEDLILERVKDKRRWENQPDDELSLRDIDREEVFRILNIAASLGRLVEPVGRSVGDALDRLGLRKDGQILRAAVVLFGRTFMPDYPQCQIRMARFRGTDKTEFLDQRHVRGPAFRLLEEAELFCQRHFPRPAKIVPEQMQRVEKPLIPPDAMREIVVNALIHRDYTIAGGAVSLAIFDDRVEVWSAGAFPRGIRPEDLRRKHLSVQRNPMIADMFHRTGLIETWGRGTNRVIAMCKEAGIPAPEFEEITRAAVVTFRVQVGIQPDAGVAQPQSRPQSRPQSQPQSQRRSLSEMVLELLVSGPLSKAEISRALGQIEVSGQLRAVLRRLHREGAIEFTIPDKPGSRMQRYRLATRA